LQGVRVFLPQVQNHITNQQVSLMNTASSKTKAVPARRFPSIRLFRHTDDTPAIVPVWDTPTHNSDSAPALSRRRALKLATLASIGLLLREKSIVPAARADIPSAAETTRSNSLLPYVNAHKKWGNEHLTNFLRHLNQVQKELLLIAVGKDAKKGDLFDVEQSKRDIRFIASNTLLYPFRNKQNYYYHEEIVRTTARHYDVDESYIENAPTLLLERKIFKAQFEKAWEKLTLEQRQKLLNEIDKDGKIVNKASIILLSGSAAIASLSTAVSLSGFAFYMTMSSAIKAAASFIGLTLPFAAYQTTTATVSILSGPIGWACVGAATLGAAFFAGRPNYGKLAGVILQIHLLKIEALEKAGLLEETMRELRVKY
jgi:uncharacterized protein YaaW (UPF0174 family)